MKLRNEGAMYIVIYISLSFHETLSLYDENYYFDSDLIPFISISTKNIHRLVKNEDSSISTKTTSQNRFSNSNLQLHHASVTAMPTRHNNSTQNIIRNISYAEVNHPLTALYKIIKENNTRDSKRNRVKEDVNILKIEDSDFLTKRVNQQFSNFVTSDLKRKEKLKFLNKTNSNGSPPTDDQPTNGIMKRNTEDFEKYAFSKFFYSLLSLLSYLNPNLLEVLNTKIKRFQMNNVMKRDSMSNNSLPYPSEDSYSTLKTMLCNCDYCRTGKPDTVLFIVSGKKLNNSVTYHKMTSINRSKSETSSRYQLQTAHDNDSNRSLQPPYLLANYDKPIFGNSIHAAINKKVINNSVHKGDSHNQLPMMKLVPVSRNLGMKLMSAYKGLRGRGFYKHLNNKIDESLSIPFRKVIEPGGQKYKPIFYSRNNPFPNNKDSKNNEENQYDRAHYNKDSIELVSSLYHLTTQSIGFSEYACDSYQNQSSNSDGAKNESTYGNLNRNISNTEVNEIAMTTSEEVNEMNCKHSLVKNGTNENLDSVEVPDNDGESLTTEANYNMTTFHPGLLKEIIKNDYLKNIFHKKRFKKVSVAAAVGKTSMFLPLVTKTALDIPSDINEDFKYMQVTHEINTISDEQIRSTEPLEKSIIDIINNLMVNVEARNVTGTNNIETTTDSITLSNDGSNRSSNDFKNNLVSNWPGKHQSSIAFNRQPGFFVSTFQRTHPTVKLTVNTTTVTTATTLNNSVNKKETYVNYDLNLRNLIGETNTDEKIMCS